jgi:hypothetical protein
MIDDIKSSLIGIWSAGIFYYDCMEDTILCFSEDGTGFLNYMRPYYEDIQLFKWEVDENRFVNIKVHSNYIISEDEISCTSMNLVFSKLEISFTKGFSLTKNEIDVIELSCEIGCENRFGINERNLEDSKYYKRIMNLIDSNS